MLCLLLGWSGIVAIDEERDTAYQCNVVRHLLGMPTAQDKQANIPLEVFEVKIDPTTNIGHVAGRTHASPSHDRAMAYGT